MDIKTFPYFDNNATTPPHHKVLEVLNEYNTKHFANPSSATHPLGIICNTLYEIHRKKIAEILGISTQELIFTSGSTESINTAIKGIFFQYASEKKHIISSKTEHSAVLQTLKYLEEHHNAKITLLDVNEHGNIDLNELERNINENTLLVCLMAANNETGILHPLEDIYQITQRKKIIFFSDTTQLFGKTILKKIPADIFCGSAHKFHGCKGTGFLAVKNLGRKIFLHPLIHGGQQQEIRSGTIPLSLIAALSTALEISYTNNSIWIKKIRDYFEIQLQKHNVKIHGEKTNRLINTSNIQFSEKYYDALIKLMKKFCYSHGSACSDGLGKPSHVLKAMGLSNQAIKHSFRFSFSHLNHKEEIDLFLNELADLIQE